MIWVTLYVRKSLNEKNVILTSYSSFTPQILDVRWKTLLRPWLLIIYICEEKKEEGFISVHWVRLRSSLWTLVLPITSIICLSL